MGRPTEKAVKEASATLKNLRSAWVKDQSVTISNGKVTEYRVTLKVSFELE
ncbi:dodecin family protein [Moheibacter stercoris]|uniref:Flavin-binding protein dodecin n=1 Tax=Moheibacter stercoris TaxID=1628251 RepID=A0ABV2LSD6_9FLAO